MRDWDVILRLSAAVPLTEDDADSVADTISGIAGVLSYRDMRLSIHVSVVASDPSEALRQTRDLLGQSGVALTLESVQIEPAAPLDEDLSAAS